MTYALDVNLATRVRDVDGRPWFGSRSPEISGAPAKACKTVRAEDDRETGARLAEALAHGGYLGAPKGWVVPRQRGDDGPS